MKDYYQILEIVSDASQDAIKEQYRFLVQAWHPDKFPNSAQKLKAEEKLKDLNEAYEILRDPAKRAEYDSRTRYKSSHQQEYSKQTARHQSEDEHRRKEEATRHAKEEQWQKERANRERAEDLTKQKISRIDYEILLLNKEINDLNQETQKLPSRKIDLFLVFGGFMFFTVGIESASINYALLFIGGLLFIIGVGLMYIRVKPNKSVLSEIKKRKYRVAQLVREKQNLKNT